MSNILIAVLKAVAFVKTLILGRDTTLTDGTIKYPGHMAFANVAGEYFHGCKVIRFWTVRALNEFFLPGNEGFLTLVSDIIPVTGGGFLVVYTKKLSDRDRETVERYGREINAKISDENEKANAEEMVHAEKRRAAELEDKRLADVGRKYEARWKKIKEMAPGLDRKREEKKLNSGDLE